MKRGNHKTAVLGLGSCGGKVVARLARIYANTPMKFAAVDSDESFLESLEEVVKISAGSARTESLGCGGSPETAEKAIRDDIGKVMNFIDGFGCVVVIGGLGKGFCTGAAPVLAETFKELDVVQIFAMTTPFAIEGNLLRTNASEALESLRTSARNVISISNDLLFSTLSADASLQDIFKVADSALTDGLCGLLDILKYEPNDAVALEFSNITELVGQRQSECSLSFAECATNDFSQLAEKIVVCPLSGGERYLAEADAMMVKISGPGFTGAESKECVETLGERLQCSDKVRFGFHTDPALDRTTVSALAIRYLTPFMRGGKNGVDGKNQLELGLVEQNLGIFASNETKVVDEKGNSLDIPTFQRLGISLDEM